jgi:hypothetical protein
MRLINVEDYSMGEFMGRNVPDYAILSPRGERKWSPSKTFRISKRQNRKRASRRSPSAASRPEEIA